MKTTLRKAAELMRKCETRIDSAFNKPEFSKYKFLKRRRQEIDNLICAITLAIEHGFDKRPEMENSLNHVRDRVEHLINYPNSPGMCIGKLTEKT